MPLELSKAFQAASERVKAGKRQVVVKYINYENENNVLPYNPNGVKRPIAFVSERRHKELSDRGGASDELKKQLVNNLRQEVHSAAQDVKDLKGELEELHQARRNILSSQEGRSKKRANSSDIWKKRFELAQKRVALHATKGFKDPGRTVLTTQKRLKRFLYNFTFPGHFVKALQSKKS